MYQVLYRKYRPQLFSDVVGQEHITDTLMNELISGRLAHAYLFTGSRGTGKTTCAKILAKAVNCRNPQNGNPCNECDVCKGIDNGTVFDVLEIDAASNNGVDNIRDLREEANYSPSVGNYRVYIIDEVHMLSTGAFNALLKTLEEPPEHVMFILATTEIHKLPATILSRCQRFDFRRIRPEAMAERINHIAALENFTVTPDGAMLIARIADGALRDALSILDQCAGRGSVVDDAMVSEVCGIADKSYLYKLSSFIKQKDVSSALDLLNDLHNASCDMERLCTEMINHYRNFLVAKTVKNARALIISTDEEYEMITAAAKEQSVEEIVFILDLFQKSLEGIKAGDNRRMEMETAFIKLCSPEMDTSATAMLSRIASLESAVANGAKNIPATGLKPLPEISGNDDFEMPFEEKTEEASAQNGAEQPKPEVSDNVTPAMEDEPTPLPADENAINSVQSDEAEEIQDKPFSQWKSVLDKVAEIDIPLLGILHNSKAVIHGDFLLIDSSNPTVKEFIKISEHNLAVRRSIFAVTGKKYRLGIYTKADAPEVKSDPLDALIEKAKQSGVNFEIK